MNYFLSVYSQDSLSLGNQTKLKELVFPSNVEAYEVSTNNVTTSHTTQEIANNIVTVGIASMKDAYMVMAACNKDIKVEEGKGNDDAQVVEASNTTVDTSSNFKDESKEVIEQGYLLFRMDYSVILVGLLRILPHQNLHVLH